jgi:hypothetical protein
MHDRLHGVNRSNRFGGEVVMIRSAMVAMAVAMTTTMIQAGPPDYFSEREKDFGVTAYGPVLVHYFTITNTSKQEVVMGTPRIGCGCVSVTLGKAKLAPNETTHLVAYMNTAKIPEKQIGLPKSVDVKVPFLTPVLEEVTLKVSCLSRPDMSWSPNDGIVFGTVQKGKPTTTTMTVSLIGNAAWKVTEAKSSGKFVKAESKEKLRDKNGMVTYEITATLDDQCPVGNWMSDLILTTNAPGIEKMRIPVTVNVVPPISVYPEVVRLGALPMGGGQSFDVTVTGLQPFKVLEVKGGDATVSVTPKTEGTKHMHTLKVDVKANAAGDLKREIQIVTDNKEMPTVILPVSYTVSK